MHNLGDELFRLVNVCLEENGLKVNRGTIVDVTIINVASSTKNKDKKAILICTRPEKGTGGFLV